MRQLPQYRVHKSKNLAFVRLGGKFIYLGRAHSPESRVQYHAVISTHLAGKPPRRIRSDAKARRALTIGELAERWYLAVRSKEGANSKTTYEASYTARELTEQHATCLVIEFGPLAFKAIRSQIVAKGRSRQGVNRLMNRIRRCIRWGVGEELVPADRIHALSSVDGLRHGTAHETEPRRAADPKAVEVCIRWLEGQDNFGAAGIIRFIRATGCRPSEATAMRWHEVMLAGDMPHYRPASHKTAHHGIDRVIPLNSDAIAAVNSCLKLRQVEGLVFTHTRGKAFTTNAILLAVRRAVRATGCADWCTYGLRHLAATTALERTGCEAAAAALLGHSPRSTIIQRYSRDRFALAMRAAKSIEEVA